MNHDRVFFYSLMGISLCFALANLSLNVLLTPLLPLIYRVTQKG